MKSLLLSILLMTSFVSLAQWVSINPGAGGQVQDVVPDPNMVGHLMLASDMEGIYESTDNGESWHPKGNLHQNRAFSVTYTNGNNDKLYIGTLYGLEVSNDGGETSTLIEITQKKSIASVAVDPQNENNVLAGIGWRDDYGFENNFGMSTNAKGMIYKSTDGGDNWTEVIFDEVVSDRNVYSINYNPIHTDTVYIGAEKGVFQSADGGDTWSLIPKPVGAGKNQGITLSPDGTKLYAIYSGSLYATPTSSISSISWVKAGIPNQNYWYPEVDPRSTGDTHKIILASRTRDKLNEVTFIWDGDTHLSHSYEAIWEGLDGYDTGWDLASPNARFAHYTPSNWDRALWSTTNQTVFEGEFNNDEYSWNNKYSIMNTDIVVNAPAWGPGSMWPSYSGRGTESTYTYDIAVHENYVIQGQADNGPVESWDGGFSWNNVWHRAAGGGSNGWNLSDVQAVTIGSANGTPTVLAQMSEGYGGAIGSAEGRLYAKKAHKPFSR